MSLWFCKWLDRASVLIDHGTKEGALVLARAGADGEAPAFITLMPEGVFSAEVVETEGAEWVSLDIDEDVACALSELEDMDHDGTAARIGSSMACGDEATTKGGDDLVCKRDVGHDGDHSCKGLVWE